MSNDTALTRPGTARGILIQLLAAEAKALERLVLGYDVSGADRVALHRAMLEGRRPTITWSEPEPGRHVIENNGAQVRLWSDLSGLAAARAAMKQPGQRAVRAAEYAQHGARYPDVAVRAALTRAAALLAGVCEPLAAAVESIRVLDGFVVFNPRGGADIVIE